MTSDVTAPIPFHHYPQAGEANHMKGLTIAALIGAQVATAQPALAADFAATQPERMGAFGGVRVRVPLGGNPHQRQIRAGLTVAPTLQGAGMEGERPLRIGEGVELGFRSGRSLSLSVAGMDVRDPRLGAAQDEEEDGNDGVSTVGWIAIGTGVVVLALGGFYWWVMEESECGPGDC